MLGFHLRRLRVLNKNENCFDSRLFGFRFCSNTSKNVTKNTNVQHEKDEFQANALLRSFASKKNQFLELHRYNPFTASPQRLREWKDGTKRNYEIFLQRYIEERHDILGSDLAAAHFIVYRGGKVKFHNREEWIEKKKDEEICKKLPVVYVRNCYVECIDASNTNIRYEGLVNLTNLIKLRWISFRNCPNVDDWFLDRISGEYANTLEYLDISDCSSVTDNGLNSFYRFQKLKRLLVHNIVRNLSFEYRCFLLEDTIPGLTIEGVKYFDGK